MAGGTGSCWMRHFSIKISDFALKPLDNHTRIWYLNDSKKNPLTRSSESGKVKHLFCCVKQSLAESKAFFNAVKTGKETELVK